MGKTKLIDKLAEQLRREKPNSIIDKGSFSDGSGSWIEIQPKGIDLAKKYVIMEVLSFNGAGTVLTDVNCYKNHIDVSFNSEKII